MSTVILWYLRLIQKQSPEMSHKKGVLENFVKFTGKLLCQNLFFNNIAALRPTSLLKLVSAIFYEIFIFHQMLVL